MITKYFNPQTHEEWVDAVQSLEEFVMSETSSNRYTLNNNEKLGKWRPREMESCHNLGNKARLSEFGFNGKMERGQ